MMTYSVIIPVYNTEKYLRRCLDSVLAYQGDLEVIALDDGSTDGSLAILQSYSDPRLKVLHHENMGVFKTWKRGVELSTGDYIVFVDSDDYVSDELFPSLNQVLAKGDYDLIQYGWTVFGDKQKPAAQLPYPMLKEGAYTGDRLQQIKDKYILIDRYTDLLETPRYRWGKAFCAKKLKDLLPHLMDSIRMFEDDSVVIPFILNMESLYILPKALYIYWIGRQGSICNSPEQFEDNLRDANAICSYFSREEFGIPAHSLDCYYLHYHLDVLWRAVLAKKDCLAGRIVDDSRFAALFKQKKGIKAHLLRKKRFRTYRFLRKIKMFFC